MPLITRFRHRPEIDGLGAVAVVAAVLFRAGGFLLLPADYKKLGQASASQAVFAANIYYWRDSDYFDTAADEKPLLHTRSLASSCYQLGRKTQG
jgi:peptidoglycan/LPS O-acetylase OafA/YrhL